MSEAPVARGRGRPFTKGGGGRPKGSKHKVTLAVEALMEGQAEGLTSKAIEMALGGDIIALKLCLDRIAPVRKERPITLDLPQMRNCEDAMVGLKKVIEAVGRGEITTAEAMNVTGLLAAFTRLSIAIGPELAELDLKIAGLLEGTAPP